MLLKAILITGATIIVLPILRVVQKMSVTENHHKHHPGDCRRVNTTGVGSEDIEITSSGIAFLTSGMIYTGCSSEFETFVKSRGSGRIELLDMTSPLSRSAKATELKILHGKDFNRETFRPHGLGLLEDKVRGQHLIYVVNHVENEADRVEKFRYIPETKELQHVRSFFSDLFLVANDIAVVDEDRFYVSNYFVSRNPVLSAIEQIYQIHRCTIVFFNETGATQVVGNLLAPNGITLSKDKRFLYAGFTLANAVRVYERQTDLDLSLVQEATIHTGIDNFHVSEDGTSLYGGAHPNTRKLFSHLMNPLEKAPSQVLRIPLQDGLILEDGISQEFYDRGDLISGSSIAGVYKDQMIVGSVVDSLVVCSLPTLHDFL